MINIFSKKFLYFPGCLSTTILPDIVDNYKRIFQNLKINFFMLTENNCCGAVAHSNGYRNDFENLRERNLQLFDDKDVKYIVTNDGNCMHTLALQYGKRVQHVSQILVKYVNKLPVKYEGKISIYDSPNLTVFEEPREILEALGFDVVDLQKNRKNTIICGAEGGMIQNVPILADKLSKNVFDMCETRSLVVTDPLSYYHLRNNAPSNIKVLELSEVII